MMICRRFVVELITLLVYKNSLFMFTQKNSFFIEIVCKNKIVNFGTIYLGAACKDNCSAFLTCKFEALAM